MGSILKRTGVTALLLGASLGVYAMAEHDPDAISRAIESADRPAEDKVRDAARKPAEILAFAGIKPGMTVLDINSGSGWYTEILSRAVGHDGRVYAHNGPVYWSFVRDSVDKRYSDRLDNVVQIHEDMEEIVLPENSVDVAMIILAYHDYFIKHKAREKDEDIPAIMQSIHKAIKPGGAFVVIDHVAPTGSGMAAGNTLHRIDPALVKEQALAAGFNLVETSDVLSNKADPHTDTPFAEGLRGHTDRFVFKFVK